LNPLVPSSRSSTSKRCPARPLTGQRPVFEALEHVAVDEHRVGRAVVAPPERVGRGVVRELGVRVAASDAKKGIAPAARAKALPVLTGTA
jgi:hypothetical protein